MGGRVREICAGLVEEFGHCGLGSAVFGVVM